MYYNECPICGASLDPGEKCDCESEVTESGDTRDCVYKQQETAVDFGGNAG